VWRSRASRLSVAHLGERAGWRLTPGLRLEVEQQTAGQPSIYTLRRGTLILEPESGPGPEHSWRLMLRVRGGIEHSANALTNRQAWGLAGCGLGIFTPEDLGVSAEPE
jgi:hypothetical protein